MVSSGCCARCARALADACRGKRAAQHGFGGIDAHQLGGQIAAAQFAQTGARSAAGVDDAPGFELDIVEALKHAPLHFARQHGRYGVSRGGARKLTPHLGMIEFGKRLVHGVQCNQV